MQLPKTILVVISGKRKVHDALERALQFAEFSDINLLLFNVIYQPIADLTDLLSKAHRDEMKQQYMADRLLYLKALADEIESKGVKCEVELVWHSDIHLAIEAAAIKHQPDLVIKGISAKSLSINPFALPTDRHLLRYCPAPLMLVKQPHWKAGPVCAAVDPMAKDTAHQQLNNTLLTYAKMLGEISQNPVYALSSYFIPPVSTAMGVPGMDYEMIRTNTYQSYSEKLQSLVKLHRLPLTDLHLVEGEAERALSNFADEHHASLMILGTVGRTGISGAFIGNTAEHLLAELTCEVLTLKPHKEAKS